MADPPGQHAHLRHGTDTSNLTSLIVPSGKLTAGSNYTWQVRYEDNYNDWSSYSTAMSFATTPVDHSCFASRLL
jgi:hypothetical protein